MRKLILNLFILANTSVYAGSSPVDLVCNWDNYPSGSNDKCLLSLNIPVQGSIATLEANNLSQYFVDLCSNLSNSNERIITTANTGENTLLSFSYNDPNRNRYIWENKHLDNNGTMSYGYYRLDAGEFELVGGQMKLTLDVPKTVIFNFNETKRLNHVAKATVVDSAGEIYSATCHLGYYNE